MKSKDFLRISSLAAAGTIAGILLPTKILATTTDTRTFKLNALDEEAYIAWLARLVIGTLVAKKVESWFGSCQCNGGACSANTPVSNAYNNTDGVYGYTNSDRRFLTQNIRDSRVQFTNVSVPFLTQDNAQLMNDEGPFLAGLCWAAEDVARSKGVTHARQLFIPRYEISNGGYRFDTRPCDPTEFASSSGKTSIHYTPNYSGGVVKVTARDNAGRNIWQRNYEMEM